VLQTRDARRTPLFAGRHLTPLFAGRHLTPLDPRAGGPEETPDTERREGRPRDLVGAEGTSVERGDGSAADIGTPDDAGQAQHTDQTIRHANREAGTDQDDYQRVAPSNE
jgi:hypothetical protein